MYKVELTHWWYKALRNIMFYWVRKLKPKKILDVGCGTGINVLMLKKKNFDVYGIDASALAIKYCKKRGLTNVYKAIMQKLPFKAEAFDLIFSFDVLGILPDKEVTKGISDIKRCLKVGGYLILNIAALQSLYSQHDIAIRTLHRYNKKEIEILLDQYNFKITKSTYRVFFLFPLVTLVKMIEKKNINKQKFENIKGDVEKTNLILNSLLYPIMLIENLLLRFINLPIGTSLFIVAQKKKV